MGADLRITKQADLGFVGTASTHLSQEGNHYLLSGHCVMSKYWLGIATTVFWFCFCFFSRGARYLELQVKALHV
jgi:hypothetical protein